jgi:hypothetical protein
LNKGFGILAPFGLVEVDREKMAGVVRQERVDTDRLLTGKVAVDDRIRYGYQRTVAAICAFDPWLLADTGTPFTRTILGPRPAGSFAVQISSPANLSFAQAGA